MKSLELNPQRSNWLREFSGPLSADLVQHPADFGLGKVPSNRLPDATTRMVCGYCSTGCALEIHLREGKAINLTASQDYCVNSGMACPKGWEALTPLASNDRGRQPMLRERKSGKWAEAKWETALSIFCQRFKSIHDRHGSDSLAWIGTGQTTTEELAFLGSLARFGLGFGHGDANTRQCMATSVVAYKESLGFDAPPYTYADFEESDVIVLIGSNLCIAHPILWQRILRNRHSPKIVVIDPRLTETARAATNHLAIRPKSDLLFFYGVARELIARGAVDLSFIGSHTNGFEDFAKFVEPFDRGLVLRETGLSEQTYSEFIDSLVAGKRVSFWWTMGVNQGHESTRTAQAIINLALMTGNMGRPGTGANSITGQCNAMGSRLFSNTTNLIGGHSFASEPDRKKVAGLLGIPLEKIPTQNCLAYDQILEGISSGRIKGLWVVGTNPVHSWIDHAGTRSLLSKLEFLVVQDLYPTTETAQEADLYLPAAGWGEKDGTLINSERRIGLIKNVSPAPGQALADFHIFRLIAQQWGCGDLFSRWSSPEAAFQILKECSRGQPCDISGIEDYEMIEQSGGIQWPWPEQPENGDAPLAPAVERRLFADGKFFHGDGRARFIFESPRPSPELASAEHPLILLTGRGSSAQWHTETRTGKSEILRRLSPRETFLEMNPHDAAARGIRAGNLVRVFSARGEMTARILITASVGSGQVFLPMHDRRTNRLTLPVFDPYSRQPGYKYCAVEVRRMKE